MNYKLVNFLILFLFGSFVYGQWVPPKFQESFLALKVEDSIYVPFISNGVDTMFVYTDSETGKLKGLNKQQLSSLLGSSNLNLQEVSDNGSNTNQILSMIGAEITNSGVPNTDGNYKFVINNEGNLELRKKFSGTWEVYLTVK